jgi:hypothetical protein
MSNLRIVSVTVNSSTQITARFTASLTPNLTTSNVTITSATAGVGDSQVLSVAVTSDYMTVTCQPLIEFAAYYITFVSVPDFPFESLNGNAFMPQDGVTNTFLFTGPISPDNPVKDYFVKFFNGNIYDTSDQNTIINQYIDSLAVNMARLLYDIRQCGNENYLFFQIVDEQQFRGAGATDRLYNEGVYEVTRVGLAPTGANATLTLTFDDFPSFPVTLQQQANAEVVTPSSSSEDGTFNINSLVLNLSNSPVTVVSSIVFVQTTINSVYTYDIQSLGYQLLNSTFDQNFASTYELLAPNQVKLNTQILNDPLFDINQIVNVTVQYQSQDLGRNVNPTSLDIYTTMTSVREVLPPIENIFTLQHAPITDSSNNVPITGGVSFLDPNSNTGSPHPAFLQEIPFSLSAPPSMPGVYSINYNTGTVYVYGASISNDGTGPYPPLATYLYRYTYVNESDYAYDPDSQELVALPLGNLVNNGAVVTYNYEEVLVPGTDYIAETHIESIDERIQNRLVALNSLTTLNSPITNVFQIYNETSGEIYTLQRWTNNNQIYFTYNTPPRVEQENGERSTFQTVSGELLFINSVATNINSVRVFTIFLANNTIIDGSEDGIGSSINSSMSFNSHGIFLIERWYNAELPAGSNTDKIVNPGDYLVDYANGIIYLGVSNIQSNNIGSVNYKMNDITPEFPHIISVNDIYYRISPLSPKNKHFSYLSFADGSIVPEGLDPSDETFLNGNTGAPYQLVNGQVGTFITGTFVAGVTNQVKTVRGVFEYSDLTFNAYPINFANASTSNSFNISVGNLTGTSFENVQFNGTNYYVNINQNLSYLSPDITYNYSIVRVSDGAQLWDSSGVVVPGTPITLVLSGNNSPQAGQLVTVTFTYSIDSLSRVVVDYNKGDFFVDYTYLADEIIVSYEYGDNVIDFSQSNAVQAGSGYYVTYNVGALRDALVKNFGSLVDLPQLDTLDVNFPRERYRDALTAALTSFLQGPTVAAIKNIGATISHIEPQVIESAFQTWSLGQGILYPNAVDTTGAFQLLPAHFGNGVLVDQPGQTITLPVNSNCRFEEGTFEEWVIPQWDGLDNDATLTFNIMRSGVPISQYRVFVGGSEFHPTITNGTFQLDKNSNVTGRPNTHKDGIFIWYGPDFSGNFNRWYMEVIDGYVAPVAPTYTIKVSSNGRFYDAKTFQLPTPSNATIFTGLSTLTINITTTNIPIQEGITFVSDLEHYFLDLGKTKDRSRLSIFKDVSGYLNFRVWDRNKVMYSISSDVSGWKAGQAHQIAASWKLSTSNSQDEMHLFVDGLEVPNIIKYGQKLQPYLHEKFRTVDPEEIVGLVNRDIVGSHDLTTTAGSQSVSSSINFSQFNIFIGDTIFINEVGFSSTGYQILGINGQTLALNDTMPLTLNGDGNFSINQTSFVVVTDIDSVPNIAVSTITPFVTGDDLSTTAGTNVISSVATNFTTKGVMPGYTIRIDSNSPVLTYTIVRVLGNTLHINGKFPVSQTDVSFQVYSNVEVELPGVHALHPDYSISENSSFQNILTITNGVYANDLVLIRTLGINSRDVSRKYYIWSNQMENILMTQLPPPISLNEANITRIITSVTAVGPANSTVISGIFYSNQLPTAKPSNAQNGRTIQATIAGTNVDFSSLVEVTINGVTGISVISETITFNDYGTLDFANPYISLNYVTVTAKPLNPAKAALTVELQEKYPITYSEFSGLVPVVRYSYPITMGYNLYNDGYDGYGIVTDDTNLFSEMDVGNYLVIQTPPPVAGFYYIVGLSDDRHSLYINSTVPSFPQPLAAFTGGIYQVLNTTDYRSGLQNGFFTLEASLLPGQAWFVDRGFYKFDYSTYLSIQLDPLNTEMFFGSDMFGHSQANAILDQTILYSVMLTDTRVGETVLPNQRSITKDFNSLIPVVPNPQTLVVLNFDTFPFVNSAPVYANLDTDRIHFQSNWAVNETFQQSVVVLDKPILLPNTGILDTTQQGTIEFWMSPLFDTANDPNLRYYFDAYGAVVTQVVSNTDVTVKIGAPASQILSVKLVAGDPNADYFAGGKLEIDTQNAVQEEGTSIGVSSVKVSQPVLQVITVKIVGDFTGTDYFAGGSLSSDKQTIYLGKVLPVANVSLVVTYQPAINDNTALNTQVIRLNRRLPNQNSLVEVNYLPQGLQGDRISIFKDIYGYINFQITASGTPFIVRAPTRWARNTWHRVKAEYQVNGSFAQDQMRLFLDGYQYTDVLFGEGLIFGRFPVTYGAVSIGDGYSLVGNITFKDPINDLFIGTQYNLQSPIYTLLDNFRISNIFRPIYAPFGEPIDVNWSNNLNTVIPVTQDLYTTYLLDYNDMIELEQSFAILTDRAVGSFDFQVNIFDSFGIVSSSSKVQSTLETLINTLKPANTVAFINYIE